MAMFEANDEDLEKLAQSMAEAAMGPRTDLKSLENLDPVRKAIFEEFMAGFGDVGWNSYQDIQKTIERLGKEEIPGVYLARRARNGERPIWVFRSCIRVDGENGMIEINGKKWEKMKIINSKPFFSFMRKNIEPLNFSSKIFSPSDFDATKMTPAEIRKVMKDEEAEGIEGLLCLMEIRSRTCDRKTYLQKRRSREDSITSF